MDRRAKFTTFIFIPLLIFLFAFLLRKIFFNGFILGDDAQELSYLLSVLSNRFYFPHQLHLRIGGWIINYLSFKLFGVSETSFFLPTLIMSSSMGVLGYFLLLSWKYQSRDAFLAGLFVASAPFEVLIGCVRANDLILSWVLAVTLLAFFLLRKDTLRQGFVLAFLFWVAFYVKFWAVYLFPILGIYYVIMILKEKSWSGAIAFSCVTLFLHGISCMLWKISIGSFFPFISMPPEIYPANNLQWLFARYPKMIFEGSEFGTTLFGFIPYFLIVFIVLKIVFLMLPRKFSDGFAWDQIDTILFLYYGSFLLFLNFLPAPFKFDQYYTIPRIFRYLAPVSFPMALHLSKSILDLKKINFQIRNIKFISLVVVSSMLVFSIVINIYQSENATRPGRTYRKALLAIVEDIKQLSPPKLIVDSWINLFFKEIYLREQKGEIEVMPVFMIFRAQEYENWLRSNQDSLPEGTLLVTGLGNFVHYGAHLDGFRLNYFENKLDPMWKLYKEYNMLTYLPFPEPARLWRHARLKSIQKR